MNRSSTEPKLRPYAIPRYSISLVKEATSQFLGQSRYHSSEDVYRYFKDLLTGQDREHFYAFCLDTKKAPIGLNHVAMGTLSTVLVHPREVFKCAILLNAACIISRVRMRPCSRILP